MVGSILTNNDKETQVPPSGGRLCGHHPSAWAANIPHRDGVSSAKAKGCVASGSSSAKGKSGQHVIVTKLGDDPSKQVTSHLVALLTPCSTELNE